MVRLADEMIGAASELHARLLVVDDDPEMRDALGMFFAAQGHACELAASADAALGIVGRLNLDAIVCDVRMDGMSGLELLDRVKRTHPTLPVVVISGRGGIPDAVDAMKRGAFQYLAKPCDLAELGASVMGAIDAHRQQVGTGAADTESDRRSSPPPTGLLPNPELVGNGPAMRLLQASIDRVADSSAPVIITGETGVGKELVARAIHARGRRRGRPFVAVNTSAIPADLLESEMFGHLRGGFTGAVQSRRGLLVEADGGTLLLDEIGDMPLGLQAKLLRVLQFGEVRPVGADRGRQVDVRVIAATHRDLPALVRDGQFRQDLYFRLNVLPVFVPPLRDRSEDIPALAAHLLAEARQRAPLSPVRSIGPAALRAMTAARWPGNVRELASVVERAVVFGTDEGVVFQSLREAGDDASSAPPWSFEGRPPPTLRNLSRVYTEWVLTQTGGTTERAAQILGIDLSTLSRWQRTRHEP